MNVKKNMLRIGLPIIIILVGVSVMAALISGRPAPKKEVQKDQGALVSVLKVEKEDRQVIVSATGTVQSAQEITVIPQVSGRVTSMSPAFVAGGFFQKGDVLFEIEDADYLLALERAVAARAKAEYDLSVVESQARIARSEWERLNEAGGPEPNPLVMHEPQMKNARAALASADAAITQAKLDLERTRVRAPFDCRVRSENIDPGQFVKSGNSVAVLAGTDTAEIIVPISPDDLQWVQVPKARNGEKGSSALILLERAGNTFRWNGHVVRSLGELDPKSRLMQIVVEVEDPYGMRKNEKSHPDLAVGTFVDVRIKGKTLIGMISIPRRAFRENSSVWTMDRTNTLSIRKVIPMRMERETVMISDGISEGDVIVLTTLSGAADGMKLRVVEEGSGK